MSERREQRRIERAAGIGKVTRGGVAVGTARYLMEIWQTFHIVKAGFGPPGPAEEIAGLMEIRVRLTQHDLDTFKLAQESASLTLHLEDGRSLDGFLNGDEFVAGGQLTQA